MKKLLFVIFSIALLHANAQMERRIIVAQDGSGNFTTVQQAFDAVPLNNQQPIHIYIKPGIYREKLHLDSTKDHLEIAGVRGKTILTYDDHTGTVAPDGTVINTMNSQTFYIAASDITLTELTIQNSAGMIAGQAVAVRVQGDRVAFNHCDILGFQDTLFASGENSRQFYQGCSIEGSTDFIFGAATALFIDCTIRSKKNSHVTAASTPKDHLYGFVFRECELVADSGLTKVSLGRPWRPYASVTYINCRIGAHILAAGWDNWKNPENEKTARFAEYNNAGPGAVVSGRAPWARQLSSTEAPQYGLHILGDWKPKFATSVGR